MNSKVKLDPQFKAATALLKGTAKNLAKGEGVATARTK